MKRSTSYIVTAMLERDDRCYADPYGRTEYVRRKFTFTKPKEAETFFKTLKKSLIHDGQTVARAWLERETITSLDEF